MSKFQKKVNYFLKKEKIFTKLVNSLVNIFNVFCLAEALLAEAEVQKTPESTMRKFII